jgi:hypothetical protein
LSTDPAAGVAPEASASERLAASRREIERGLATERPGPVLQVVAPIAHEHPWALVAATAAAGALVVAARPWRWLPPPAVMASLLSQLALNALRQRTHHRHRGHHGEPHDPGPGRHRD